VCKAIPKSHAKYFHIDDDGDDSILNETCNFLIGKLCGNALEQWNRTCNEKVGQQRVNKKTTPARQILAQRDNKSSDRPWIT
jgi:hypothetical protein